MITLETKVMELPLPTRPKKVLTRPFHFSRQLGKPDPYIEEEDVTVGDVFEHIRNLMQLEHCGISTAKDIIFFFEENGFADEAAVWKAQLPQEPAVPLRTSNIMNPYINLFMTEWDKYFKDEETFRNSRFFEQEAFGVCCHPYGFTIHLGAAFNSFDDVVSGERTLKAIISPCMEHDDAARHPEVACEQSELFPLSWSGFKTACEWLDSKRIEIIKEML